MQRIYEELLEKGLTKSLRHFSKNYLGKSPNYVADRGWDLISVSALAFCAVRLRAVGEVALAEIATRRMDDLAPFTASTPAKGSTPSTPKVNPVELMAAMEAMDALSGAAR